ncbi:MAG TPA: DUF6599 family protein [Polyangiaceae bacterium]|jgi:hypothetical protein|nr:DUF6599 family protein [Polyangiaceae bacterium]
MAVRVCAYSALSLLLGALACDKGDEAKNDRQPPPGPPPAASSAGPAADLCAAGGGTDTDSISAPFIPRAVGHYCLDPQGEPRTYGAQGKLSMDEVCTTAFDGECEVYKRFGLDRVVVLRYVDGTGAPNSVEVNLSRFATSDGAYAMFTKRVVAEGDPAAATVKPAAFGAVGATSSSNAYVWRGSYLVELTFVTEDTKMTPEQMAEQNQSATGAIAREIGSRLPGPTDLPPAAAALPDAQRLPLGIAYHPKEALGVSGVGPAAVGYYKDGDKRWRQVAVSRADVEGAKEVFRAFKLKPGSLPLKGVGDEAVQVVVQEAPDRAKAEYLVARRASLVAAVGDEELVLDPGTPNDKQSSLKLTHDEKLARLTTWLERGK